MVSDVSSDRLSLTEKMQVLQVLDRLRLRLQEKGDTTQNEKLSVFYETLKSPLFNQILTLQQSIKQLKGQVSDSLVASDQWRSIGGLSLLG